MAKDHGQQNLQESWEEKMMHGKYPKRLKDVDQRKTNQWLRSTGLKGETEGLMIAAQDMSPATCCYHHCIMKDATDPHCGICRKFAESIDQIVSGCWN